MTVTAASRRDFSGHPFIFRLQFHRGAAIKDVFLARRDAIETDIGGTPMPR
jgi:hypothetical protein